MEKDNRYVLPIFLLILLIALAGWYYAQNKSAATAQEQPVTVLELAGPIAVPEAELSGLGWHGETLILLPQYPEGFGDGDGALFALSKQDILAALDGTHPTPLEPAPVHLTAPGLKESIPNFQGYEAIGFHGNQVFLTIEAGEGIDMHGYIVSGEISADSTEITLDTSNVVEIPMAFPSDNHSDEALIVTEDSVLTFFEINGADLNPAPSAHVFSFDLEPQGTLSLPNLEYRLTDAVLDSNNIWVINYFFPGDTDLATSNDPLVAAYGEGPTHAQQEQVERLVEMNYSPNGITLANSAPIQLTLDGDNARNLEGLVALDKQGFLLVTDKFPSTMLIFVEMP
ncbi:MAG: hypothetical protein JNK32_11080 [Anaerolineales bacterium]|nr:hypothetical protein [Anaerolineales bacterium]